VPGLELDYVGLCWGDDLTVTSTEQQWAMRDFKGATWRDIRSAIKQQYLLNKYRVLLSRAREGLIIWVPPGDPDDPTRESARLDRTAAFLERAGLAYTGRNNGGGDVDRAIWRAGLGCGRVGTAVRPGGAGTPIQPGQT
jgi:Uncharacterized conserved protein (DUF2075)